MKRIIIFLHFSVLILFLSSACTPQEIDYSTTIKAVYFNGSQYTVKVEGCSGEGFTAEGFTINPDERCEACISSYLCSEQEYYSENHPNGIACILPAAATIIFNGEYIVKATDGFAIRNIENYAIERVEDGFWVCTYTFTDEDYDYAKEHGENLN